MRGTEIGLVNLRHEQGARMGIVAFSKIRNFAGYYRTILFIRSDTGTCECVCVNVCEEEIDAKRIKYEFA